MVNQAEYGIRIRVAAPQEYVNTYSTRRDVASPVQCVGLSGSLIDWLIMCISSLSHREYRL